MGAATLLGSLVSLASKQAVAERYDWIFKADMDEPEVEFQRWYDVLVSNSQSLKQGRISSLQWQQLIGKAYDRAPLLSLRDALDFGNLKEEIIRSVPADKSEFFKEVKLKTNFHIHQGERQKLITKVAHVKKGECIPPHGHSNMASAFLVLSGEFDVKQFDKLEDRDNHLVVRKTIDLKNQKAGTWSSIGDYKNNVHWLEAKTDDCFIFSSKVVSVEKSRDLKGRMNIDLLNSKVIGSNTFVAEKISGQKAKEIYK
jgi:hypothetical protein